MLLVHLDWSPVTGAISLVEGLVIKTNEELKFTSNSCELCVHVTIVDRRIPHVLRALVFVVDLIKLLLVVGVSIERSPHTHTQSSTGHRQSCQLLFVQVNRRIRNGKVTNINKGKFVQCRGGERGGGGGGGRRERGITCCSGSVVSADLLVQMRACRGTNKKRSARAFFSLTLAIARERKSLCLHLRSPIG